MPKTSRPHSSARLAMRAADSDRDRTIELLCDHASAGRLSFDELADRTQAALASRTYGELGALLADLPQTEPGRSRPTRSRKPIRRHLTATLGILAPLAGPGLGAVDERPAALERAQDVLELRAESAEETVELRLEQEEDRLEERFEAAED